MRYRLVAGAAWLAVCGLALGIGMHPARAAETLGNADYVPPTHPGYVLLTTKVYTPADLSVPLFNEIWRVWPEELRAAAEKATPAQRRRMSLARYGLPEAPERGGEGPPLGAVAHGDLWAMNCLACHGGKVAGRTMPGLGNSHYALQTLLQDVVKAQVARREPLDTGNLSGMLVPLNRSNGATNAQVLAVVLAGMRDNELNFRPGQPLPRMAHHDLDAPPWWNTKKKSHLYIDGYVAKTHRVIMQFSLSPANNADAIKSWDDDFRQILAWIESIEAPRYPWSINTTLADRGRGVFEKTCAECHGTYGPGGSYPEKTVPWDDVGTDPVRLTGIPVEHRKFLRDSWLGEYGKVDVVETPGGYVAPPLDGIWASAPYFHNGSVPTLWHVLHSDHRPVVWLRSEDGYDTERAGLEVAEWSELPSTVTRADEKRRYFDTRLTGKSAAGHTFPDALSEDERTALLEYLKTL